MSSAPELPPPLILPFDANLVLGPLVWGTIIECALLMLLLLESVRYWRNSGKTDRLCLRLWIASIDILVPINTIANCAHVYSFNVLNWGNIAYVAQSWHWFLVLSTVCCGLTGTSCQSFLLYRLWKLSPSRVFAIGVIIPLTAIMFLAPVGYFGVVVRQEEGLSHFNEIFILMWFVSCAAEDLGVSLALIYVFLSIKRQYTATSFRFQRIAFRAVASGSLTAVLALIILVLYRTKPNSTIPSGLAAVLAPIYGITMLVALNHRHIDSFKETQSHSKGHPTISLAQSIHLEHVRTVHTQDDSEGSTYQANEKQSMARDDINIFNGKPFDDFESQPQTQGEVRWQ